VIANSDGGLALVLSGGGARAAYQIGLLARVAEELPDLEVEVLTGVSAGALNAAYLAAREGNLSERLASLTRVWSRIRVEDVLDADTGTLSGGVVAWGSRLMGGGKLKLLSASGLVGTEPLANLMRDVLNVGHNDSPIPSIAGALENSPLRAVAVTGSSYTTGRSVTWIQAHAEDHRWQSWERPTRVGVTAPITVDRILASASLPFLFPAVNVDGQWFGDGGIRLLAPLSPAVHLGASKVLAVTTRYAKTDAEAAQAQVDDYPPPIQIGGSLLNAVFLDSFDQDALTMQRINHLTSRLPKEERAGLRPIGLLVLRPSKDLGALANDYEFRLPKPLRFMVRGLGTRETRSNDLLSLIMFQEDYLHALLDLGRADAEAQLEPILTFLQA
jgi:NTE family protein